MISFHEQDAAYVAWRDTHPQGYVVNHEPIPTANYLKLHRATCWSLQGEPLGGRGSSWTSTYAKTCSDDIRELESWAARIPGELDPCSHCQPL